MPRRASCSSAQLSRTLCSSCACERWCMSARDRRRRGVRPTRRTTRARSIARGGSRATAVIKQSSPAACRWSVGLRLALQLGLHVASGSTPEQKQAPDLQKLSEQGWQLANSCYLLLARIVLSMVGMLAIMLQCCCAPMHMPWAAE